MRRMVVWRPEEGSISLTLYHTSATFLSNCHYNSSSGPASEFIDSRSFSTHPLCCHYYDISLLPPPSHLLVFHGPLGWSAAYLADVQPTTGAASDIISSSAECYSQQ